MFYYENPPSATLQLALKIKTKKQTLAQGCQENFELKPQIIFFTISNQLANALQPARIAIANRCSAVENSK